MAAPRYALSVVVEHGGGGSAVAGPIAHDIMLETQRRNPVRATAGALESAGIAVSTRPDPFTTAVVSGALVVVAIVAGALPAARAARVPPAEALRSY